MTAAADGSFTTSWTTTADMGGQSLVLTASGAQGDSASTSFAESADPVLTTDQSNYAPGATVQIAGSGFVPNETVTLQVVDGLSGLALAGASPWSATTDSDGSFTATWTATGPDSIGPNFLVTATGAQGDVASSQFAVLAPAAGPTVMTDLPNYQPGSTAVITGSGFVPDESVTLEVINSATGQPAEGNNPWTVTADNNGSFTTTWYVNPADGLAQLDPFGQRQPGRFGQYQFRGRNAESRLHHGHV